MMCAHCTCFCVSNRFLNVPLRQRNLVCFETFAALGIVTLELWPVVGLELWPAVSRLSMFLMLRLPRSKGTEASSLLSLRIK